MLRPNSDIIRDLKRISDQEIVRNWTAEKFNRVVATSIKNYWPGSAVEVYEERKGITKPDILVTVDGLIIPIEVKRRTQIGHFKIREVRGHRFLRNNNGLEYTIYFEDRSKLVPVKNGVGYERQYFGHQAAAMLRNYRSSVFLVSANVRPFSPVYRHTKIGPIFLGNFQTFADLLDLAYKFLKNPR